MMGLGFALVLLVLGGIRELLGQGTLPEFLLVIVPFALFLGIMLAFGRMYSENEMTVLSACGYSYNFV